MVQLSQETYMIIFFIKTFMINIYMYYSFNKIVNKEKNKWYNNLIFIVFNIVLVSIQAFIDGKINSVLSILMIYLIFAIFISFIQKVKIGYALIVTTISYAVCNIALLISVIINYILYIGIYRLNYYLNLISVQLVQFAFIYCFFKIKRFSKGFAFIQNKLNNEITDVIVSFVSISIMLLAAITGTLYGNNVGVAKDMFIIFVILGITMYIMIRRTLTMHYKQTQLLKTLNEYKEEIEEKNKEIEKLSKEKFNTSKIRHEFYHRQKALELLVKENMSNINSITAENTSNNILEIINSLTEEYSKECEKIKQLPELMKTDIVEIDSMFKYMQNECAKNGIDFKLKIIGNIHSLINNVIPKNKLETLIGDHLKDAINAVNNEEIKSKEIFAVLGMKDKKYEFTVYDTGIEFEINTLLNLGKRAVTTCANKGGSGIGFLTTFETMEETKASLIITENKPAEDRIYTKSVTIRFDSKHEYKVRSYRADKIKTNNDKNNIIIEKI